MNTDIIKELFDNLNKNYTNLKCIHLINEDKITLKDSEGGKCRFCGKSDPNVKFKTLTHAIPEFLGNKILISEFECDSCNKLFATMESEMAEYMNLYLRASRTGGKKAIQTYKPNSREFSKIIQDKEKLHVQLKDDENEICVFNESAQTITFKGQRTYTPQNIFKCLTKMAMSVMPENELDNFRNTMKWLQGNISYSSNLISFFKIYGGHKPFPFITCALFKRKESFVKNVPYCLFIFAFDNYSFQIHIPCCDKDSILDAKTVSFIPIPNPLDIADHKPIFSQLDFSSTKKVKKEEYQVTLSYEDLKEVPIDNKKETE